MAIIQFASLVLSVILIVLGANNRAKAAQAVPVPKPAPPQKPVSPQKPDDEIDYMDEILND